VDLSDSTAAAKKAKNGKKSLKQRAAGAAANNDNSNNDNNSSSSSSSSSSANKNTRLPQISKKGGSKAPVNKPGGKVLPKQPQVLSRQLRR
jgi:hypothetical protein